MRDSTAPTTAHNTTTAEQVRDDFLSYYRDTTRSVYAGDLRIFFGWCADQRLDPLEARRANLEAFVRYLAEDRGNAPRSIARRFGTVRGFYKIALADELVNVAIIGVGAIGVYAVPNFPPGPARILKTAVAFVAAGLVALASFLTEGITTAEWLQIAVAAFAGVGVFIVPNESPLPIAEVAYVVDAPDPGGTPPAIAHRGAHNE